MKNKRTNSTEEEEASLDEYLGVKEEIHFTPEDGETAEFLETESTDEDDETEEFLETEFTDWVSSC